MLTLELLGHFRLSDDTRSVGRLAKKSQALLAYLTCHSSEAIPRERLATLLWGYSDPDHARQSLRQALVTIRTALGTAHDVLTIDAATVRLVASGELTVDVKEFEALVQLADSAALARASALYRGEYLAGLHVSSEAFEEWLSVERPRLLGVACEIQRRLATAYADTGAPDAAIEAARRLTQLDPLGEDGHRLLIRLLAAAGQRSAALAQYTSLSGRLRSELGLAPERETGELVDAIRRGEPHSTAPSRGRRASHTTVSGEDKSTVPHFGPTAPVAPVSGDGPTRLHHLTVEPERQHVSFTLDPGGVDAAERVTEFFDTCGLAWGVHRDVARRVAFGVGQAIETIREYCDPSGPLLIEARCDDFDVDVRMIYHGTVLELPEQRPSEAEIIETGDHQLAGFMLRRNADRIRQALKGGTVVLKFRFER
jgi:DNA-binding SARP family transcriptional activator